MILIAYKGLRKYVFKRSLNKILLALYRRSLHDRILRLGNLCQHFIDWLYNGDDLFHWKLPILWGNHRWHILRMTLGSFCMWMKRSLVVAFFNHGYFWQHFLKSFGLLYLHITDKYDCYLNMSERLAIQNNQSLQFEVHS